MRSVSSTALLRVRVAAEMLEALIRLSATRHSRGRYGSCRPRVSLRRRRSRRAHRARDPRQASGKRVAFPSRLNPVGHRLYPGAGLAELFGQEIQGRLSHFGCLSDQSEQGLGVVDTRA